MSRRPVLANWMRKKGYENIPHYEFYRELFPQGELTEWSPNPKDTEEAEWRFNGVILERTNQTRMVPKRDRLTGETHWIEQHRTKRHIVCEDLHAIDRIVERSQKEGHQCYMSPVSYCGRSRATKNERFYYALVIEIDGLITEKVEGQHARRQKGMEALLHQWGVGNNPQWTGGMYVAPTAMVCSGSGVHLYWFLKDPYPLFGNKGPDGKSWRMEQWELFKSSFAKYVWNDFVSDVPYQAEYHGQSFRLVGSMSKKNEIVEAFWISKKRYSMEELFNQKGCVAKDIHEPAPREAWDTTTKKEMDLTKCADMKMSPTMIEAQRKWPKWFQERVIEKKPPKQKGYWTASTNVYEWYKKQIENEPHAGCRYYRLYTLAQYGAKCGVPYNQVKKDCWEYGRQFQQIDPEAPLLDWEIEKAIQAYFHPQASESTIDFINEKAHLNIQKNKRNWRKRYEHLQADRVKNDKGIPVRNQCKDNRESVLLYMRANGMLEGRPIGSGTKQSIVKQWRQENPNGKKADCIRETGLTKPTVYKWWDA